jgi:non-heme chloroperoxidase
MLRSLTHSAVAAVIGLASPAAIAQTSAPSQPLQIRANGVDLSYVSQGSGAPVVFVHGAVTDLRYWEPQRTAFAKQYRFIAYSYRYHGTGPWPDEGKQYSAETHAADLAAFINALGVGPVHLVGLSYGGMLAATVASKQPQLVRTLTLGEPGLFELLAGAPDGKAALEAWMKGTVPVLASIKAGDIDGATRHLVAVVLGQPVEHFDKLPAGLRQGLIDNSRTLPLLFVGPPANITCEMLGGIKQPTLVVRGERTPRFFVATNAAVNRCISGSTTATISNASHAMSYDNPAEFNRVVMAFLAKHGAAPTRQP